MTGISKRKNQLKEQARNLIAKNTIKQRVLRPRKKTPVKTKSSKKACPTQQPQLTPQASVSRPPPSTVTRAAQKQWVERNRRVKFQRLSNLQKAHLVMAKNKRQNSPRRSDSPDNSQSLFSPLSSLRILRETKLSDRSHKKLRHYAAVTGKPHLLASRNKCYEAKKKLEEGMEYILEGDVIHLKSISMAILKRLEILNRDVNKKALLSVDKGQGRVIVTLAFPFRHSDREDLISRPCSNTNHLVLASWTGEDKYDALKKRISDIYGILSELDLEILLGGDLAYLCANFGAHSSMSQPCPWCDHYFDKAKASDNSSIPFDPVPATKKKKAVPRRDPIWSVDLLNIVPPVLHIKLKIGNDLLERLRAAAERECKLAEVDAVLKRIGLKKDRRNTKIVYSELNGGDVTKFSQSWKMFEGISTDNDYKDVVSTLQAFHSWSQLASKTDLNLSQEHLTKLCCNHHDFEKGPNCCTTYTLVKCLENLGGFGKSVKIHVLAQHVGPFIWKHRILGACAEEGLESLHRAIADDYENISRSDDQERARIAIQRHAVQVLLVDQGKCVE